MGVLLVNWLKMDPEQKGLTAAEVIDRLFKDKSPSLFDGHADMKDAIEALVARPDSRSLGYRIRAHRRAYLQRTVHRQGSRTEPSYPLGRVPRQSLQLAASRN